MNELQTWTLQVGHAEAMLAAIDGKRAPALAQAVDPRAFADVQRLAEAEFSALQAKLAGINAELARRQAEHQSTLALVSKLEKDLTYRAPARRRP